MCIVTAFFLLNPSLFLGIIKAVTIIILRLTGKRDRLIGCVEKESILDKDISTCLPVSLNLPDTLSSLVSSCGGAYALPV